MVGYLREKTRRMKHLIRKILKEETDREALIYKLIPKTTEIDDMMKGQHRFSYQMQELCKNGVPKIGGTIIFEGVHAADNQVGLLFFVHLVKINGKKVFPDKISAYVVSDALKKLYRSKIRVVFPEADYIDVAIRRHDIGREWFNW